MAHSLGDGDGDYDTTIKYTYSLVSLTVCFETRDDCSSKCGKDSNIVVCKGRVLCSISRDAELLLKHCKVLDMRARPRKAERLTKIRR